MRHSVLSITNIPSLMHNIREALAEKKEDFCLLYQTSNPVDAASMIKIFPIQIVIYQENTPFYNIGMFLDDIIKTATDITVIFVGEDPTTYLTLSKSKNISSTISLEDASKDAIIDALELARASTGSENHFYQNIDGYPFKNYYFHWIDKSNQLMDALINIDSTTEISPEEIPLNPKLPYAIVNVRLNTPEGWTFYNQKSDYLGLLYQNLNELIENTSGTVLITSDKKLCFIFSINNKYSNDEILDFCTRAEEMRKKLSLPTFEFSASEAETDFSSLSKVFRKVDSTQKYHFFTGPSKIITPKWLYSEKQRTLSTEHFENLLSLVSNSFSGRDREGLKDAIPQVLKYTISLLSFNAHDYIWGQLSFLYYYEAQAANIEPSPDMARISRYKHDNINEKYNMLTDCFLELYDKIAESSISSVDNRHILNASNYMKTNITSLLTLSEVAGAIHVTPSYLSHLFQKELNMTFIQYKNEIKVIYAASLLKQNMKINDVAMEAGFSDTKYFSKTFKQIKGVTPREYKKSFLQES